MTISVRVDAAVKRRAEEGAQRYGMSLDEAVEKYLTWLARTALNNTDSTPDLMTQARRRHFMRQRDHITDVLLELNDSTEEALGCLQSLARPRFPSPFLGVSPIGEGEFEAGRNRFEEEKGRWDHLSAPCPGCCRLWREGCRTQNPWTRSRVWARLGHRARESHVLPLTFSGYAS